MDALWAVLVPLSPFGIAILVVGALAVLAGVFVLQPAQKKAEANTPYEDPDDDPAVIKVSRVRKTTLVVGLVLVVLGALTFSAPQWATII